MTQPNQPTPSSLDVERMASLRSWGGLPSEFSERVRRNVTVDCGWGKVLFAQTFDDLQAIANDALKLRREELARCEAIIRE